VMGIVESFGVGREGLSVGRLRPKVCDERGGFVREEM
jgi:hypothetical protein